MLTRLFHPVTARWFADRFGEPTEPQLLGWPAIADGRNTLIAAPTGSGKTLAAFLASIDGLLRQSLSGDLPDETQVLYISPLKALSNDVKRNLEVPLEEIRHCAIEAGYEPSPIRAQVRTGDTPSSARQAMLRRPPHILVTTPESLFILITTDRGRKMLRTVRTVIVDEIHALARDKRGSHLTLTLERLDHLCETPPIRIGLSATQRPIDEIGRFLVGAKNVDASGLSNLAIIDVGHVRELDMAIEVPPTELSMVCSNEQWGEIYDRIIELIETHRSTLVFVNTRRLAERVSHHLTERLGEGAVASHHGSLSKEIRLSAEERLKTGQLKAIVATASLELGIDIGYIDLMVQIGSPRSIATFLQRVGRSGHSLGVVPKGRLFPLSRDELIECFALVRAVRGGRLDRVEIPKAPIDILAQQIVAAVASEEWDETELFELCRGAWPYRDLSRKDFDEVVKMQSEGIAVGRRMSSYIHRDAIHGQLKARRSARLAAVTSGGAIPETAQYRVVTADDRTFIGMVDEDFAVESLAGDVFLLGNTSWMIRYVRGGEVVVHDAQGAPPSIPFWLGEAPGRTIELSAEVSQLRKDIARLVEPMVGKASDSEGERESSEEAPSEQPVRANGAPARSAGQALPYEESPSSSPGPRTPDPAPRSSSPGPRTPAPAPRSSPPDPRSPDPGPRSSSPGPRPPAPDPSSEAIDWLIAECGASEWAAKQAAIYVAAQLSAIGLVPTQEKVVFERFFDESGGMQLVIHAPFGSRINRAWGLAMRKRFCRSFDFELQAAADDDGIVLSIGPQHSFPIDHLFKMLNAQNGEGLLVQALLAVPMFQIRWRWNVTRALAVLRQRGGKKVPPHLQRFRSDDLLSAVFPAQTACQENVVGDIEIPDHPLVNQTVYDCLHEAMDVDRWLDVFRDVAAGKIEFIPCDTREPSPFSYELLNANPYAFLDDAPLEERRARAVATRRSLTVESVRDLGRLDPDVIDQVRREAWPIVRDPDELHDVLLVMGALPAQEGAPWIADFRKLIAHGRATVIDPHDTGATRSSSADDPAPGATGGLPASAENALPALGAGLRPRRSPTEGLPPSDPDATGSASAESSTNGPALWIAAEKLPLLQAIFPEATVQPPIDLPESLRQEIAPEKATVELVRGRLSYSGPVTASSIASALSLREGAVNAALEALEGEGFVLRGHFTCPAGEIEWCERRLLARIHRLTLDGARKRIQPVAPAEFWRFLVHHQRVDLKERLEGRRGTLEIIEQLQGFETPAGAWEHDILPSRIKEYEPAWLDELALRGDVTWGRLQPPHKKEDVAPSASGMTRVVPISLAARADLSWLLPPDRFQSESFARSNARLVFDSLVQHGALFNQDLIAVTGLLPTQLEDALSELAALGLVTADGFAPIRKIVAPDRKLPGSNRRRRSRPARTSAGGRWSRFPGAFGAIPIRPPGATGQGGATGGLPASVSGNSNSVPANPSQGSDRAQRWAWLLLRRYGVMFRDLLSRETVAPLWGELVPLYRRMEARGEIRGGRFVTGVAGEQFALPKAVEQLREIREQTEPGDWLVLSAADSLNLVGILTPGSRLPATRSNTFALWGGRLIASQQAGEITFHEKVDSPIAERIARALKMTEVYRQQAAERERELSATAVRSARF